jgi:protein-S-isoprenylcysteine O-methyltransferase Ste14
MPRKHEQRNDLGGEHCFTDAGQIAGFFLFLIIWIPDSFIFKFSTFLQKYIPAFVSIPIAVLLSILSLVMAAKSHKIVFQEKRDPPSVITKSFFKYVRHPLYLSELILYLALFVFSFSICSFIILIFIFIFLNFAATFEEKKLEELFGADYIAYKRKTGKWFPKFRK